MMTWQKKGLIFHAQKNLSNIGLNEGFAQSPQLLDMGNFVRVYFSTRKEDFKQKYLSNVFFVDFDKKFKKVLNVSRVPVVELGKLGAYDEHGIFPLHVRRFEGQIYGFIGGWSRRDSVSVDGAIGLAKSYDKGVTFVKESDGPILTSSVNEPFLIGDPFVVCHKKKYYMWYIYGTRWISSSESSFPERVYKIGMASSDNLKKWNKFGRQVIPDKIGPLECQALPSVCFYDNIFHMVFCYRYAFGFRKKKCNAYRLGYAYSKDLINWTREDKILNLNRSQSGWDSDMICYPHLASFDKNLFLLYNGNQFGKNGFGLAVLIKR